MDKETGIKYIMECYSVIILNNFMAIQMQPQVLLSGIRGSWENVEWPLLYKE